MAVMRIFSTWGISIHALRVEGDATIALEFDTTPQFLSTPSGWRATLARVVKKVVKCYFYPRPPGGGRPAPGR